MDTNIIRLLQTLKDVDKDYEDVSDDEMYRLYIIRYTSWKKGTLKDFILSNSYQWEKQK